ncbi:MAG: GGDEF domain-containing protein [Terracidiphilus sp.]
MNWRVLPDIAAITLLICAFASTARRHYSAAARVWLIGWLMIAVHFIALLFAKVPGSIGLLGATVSLISLVSAGELFKTSIIPFRSETSSRWMTGLLLAVNALYITLLVVGARPVWILSVIAVLFGIGPLAITLAALPAGKYALRWSTVAQNVVLACFLLAFQNRPGNGANLALSAVMFTIYLGCSVNFFFAYRRATAGAFITIVGFVAWASVFVVGNWMLYRFPNIHVESEVWNLPKYLVAVGMILLLLESQVEDNKFLALHDALTGLPNRRLFEDRMASALERSRRTATQMALLVIDLDYFKQVNDTLGHHVGDQVLQQVASIFTERVRRSDTVSRTGGDEFSVILEEPTNREEAENVSRALRQLLDTPLSLNDHEVQIGASIGIAIFPEDANDAESLCIVADRRMYEAKHYSQRLNQETPPTRWKAISHRKPESKHTPRAPQ